MKERVYFTIINIQEYISSDEFCWDKAINLVSKKLYPYFAATMGSYCDNIANFRKSYKSEPIFIPIDNCPERTSGQLFMLKDIVNNTESVTNFPILTIDPILKKYYSSFNIKLKSGLYFGGKDNSIVIPNCNFNKEYIDKSNYLTDNNKLSISKSSKYSEEVNDFRNEMDFDDV